MEIYEFCNSATLVNYLTEHEIQLDAIQQACIVFHSRLSTLTDKLKMYQQILDTTDDMPIMVEPKFEKDFMHLPTNAHEYIQTYLSQQERALKILPDQVGTFGYFISIAYQDPITRMPKRYEYRPDTAVLTFKRIKGIYLNHFDKLCKQYRLINDGYVTVFGVVDAGTYTIHMNLGTNRIEDLSMIPRPITENHIPGFKYIKHGIPNPFVRGQLLVPLPEHTSSFRDVPAILDFVFDSDSELSKESTTSVEDSWCTLSTYKAIQAQDKKEEYELFNGQAYGYVLETDPLDIKHQQLCDFLDLTEMHSSVSGWYRLLNIVSSIIRYPNDFNPAVVSEDAVKMVREIFQQKLSLIN